MPERAKPPIFRSALTAWLETFLALSSMKMVTGVAFVAIAAVAILGDLIEGLIGAPPLWAQLLRFPFCIPEAFVEAPFAIAVHRYVLLGEVTKRYRLTPSEPRFMRYFGFTVVIQVLMSFRYMRVPVQMEALLFAVAAISIVALVVSVRTSILFPAVAVDAAAATWRNAMRDTKGHFWRLLVIIGITLLPAVVLDYLPAYLVVPGFFAAPIGILLAATYSIVQVSTLAAVATRLYGALADKLGPPRTVAIPDVFD
jgi:hypothetical protein